MAIITLNPTAQRTQTSYNGSGFNESSSGIIRAGSMEAGTFGSLFRFEPPADLVNSTINSCTLTLLARSIETNGALRTAIGFKHSDVAIASQNFSTPSSFLLLRSPSYDNISVGTLVPTSYTTIELDLTSRLSLALASGAGINNLVLQWLFEAYQAAAGGPNVALMDAPGVDGDQNAPSLFIDYTPPAALSLAVSLNPSTITLGQTSTLTVTRAGGDTTSNLAVTLASGTPSVATVPASVTITANNLTATATVQSVAEGTSVITATSGAASDTETITVEIAETESAVMTRIGLERYERGTLQNQTLKMRLYQTAPPNFELATYVQVPGLAGFGATTQTMVPTSTQAVNAATFYESIEWTNQTASPITIGGWAVGVDADAGPCWVTPFPAPITLNPGSTIRITDSKAVFNRAN